MLTDAQRFHLQAALRSAVLRFGPIYQRTRTIENIVRYMLRRPHDSDFRFLARLAGPSDTFLDVGANSGVSAVSFRIFNRTAPVVSLEPNPIHEPDLRFAGRLVKRYSYALVAAGDRNGEAVLHVPTYRGSQITPLASFSEKLLADWRPADPVR